MLTRILRWLDANAEKAVIVVSYSIMAFIIFSEVIKRFVFKIQSPWSTSIPVYMFLFVAWTGAAYNVKTRTHLCFSEFRCRLSRKVQFVLQIVDAVCWWVFGIIVIIYSSEQVWIAYDNSAIVYGTNDLPLFIFFCITPLSWMLILLRSAQNLMEDTAKYRQGIPFVTDTPLGS